MKTEKVHYYKFISGNGFPIIADSGFCFNAYLPGGKRAGAWLPRRSPVIMCKCGWHVLDARQIPRFVERWVNPGDRLFEVEVRGAEMRVLDKSAFASIRFIREIKRWKKDQPDLTHSTTVAEFVKTLNLK